MTTARETEYVAWPSWATGPNGESQVFDSEAEVPAGWTHHGQTKPGKAAKGNASSSAPVTPASSDAATETATDAAPVDAAGVPWNEELHRSTKSKNKAGLWHMKVGVSRPATEAPLDL